MVKTNKLGLIGKLFLAGTLAVAGLVQGCQPLSYVQEQRLGTLTNLAIRNQEQKARNEAIRDSKSEVTFYIGINGKKEELTYYTDGKNHYKVVERDGELIAIEKNGEPIATK